MWHFSRNGHEHFHEKKYSTYKEKYMQSQEDRATLVMLGEPEQASMVRDA